MTAHALQFAVGCMTAATGIFLIGAACHGYVERAWSWLRSLPSRVRAAQRHGGRHLRHPETVPGSSLARDHLYLQVPAAQVQAHAGYSCCRHCEDGSPCDPRDSHPTPCFDCDGDQARDLTSEAAASVLLANRNAEALGFPMRIALTAAEHANAVRVAGDPGLAPSPQGENPYPRYVPADQPVQRVHADGDPFTGEMPILTEAAILAWKAEQDRKRYVRAHEDAVRAVVYGEAPVLAVDEAQRLADRTLT